MIDYGINPISGKTLAEEIEIGRAIGGRLPYRAYVSLIQRGLIKPRRKRRRNKDAKKPQKFPPIPTAFGELLDRL